MKKILILADHFPNRIQPWLLNWVIESIKRGSSVNIIAGGALGDSWQNQVHEYDLLDKVEYYPGNSIGDHFSLLLRYFLPFTRSGQRTYVGLWKMVRSRFAGIESPKGLIRAMARAQALSGTQYDIIHSHTLGMSYEYLFLKKTLNIPLVTTFHGLPPFGVPLLATGKLMSVFEACDLFLVNTNFAKQQLTDLGCLPEKISILPQGINLTNYPFNNKPYPFSGHIIVLTVARFHKDKGHSYAIKAISALVKIGYLIEYRIVGTGPEKIAILNLIQEEGLLEQVKVLESLNDEELHQQYAQANIFILPSIRDLEGVHEETQGVVIQEAQASGVIVIATRTGGIPECVIDEENAFLVSDRSSDEIAEKVKYIIESPEKWPDWQLKARKHVEENFAIEVLADKLNVIYDEVIEEHRKLNFP